MKKLAFVLIALTMALTASAQFEEGKMYGGASLSGLDLNYNGSKELSLNVDAKAGYCFLDNMMVLGKVGIQTDKAGTSLSIGAGYRYYIIQNGIYLGANLTMKQVEHGITGDSERHNDFMPGVEVGYAFFINRHCTVEPAIYYDQSFKSHKDFSTIGFRIGFGIYM